MSLPHLKKQIILKKNEDRRIRSGHPWAFSNEIREMKGEPASGDVVELLAANGLALGIGLYNPHSLIAVRLLSTQIEEVGFDFFQRRIERALALRKMVYPDSTSFRLVHGESDLLPGLIVDKYNDYLVVQTFSYGMDIRLTMICDALESLLCPVGIIERNESPMRQLEKLPLKKGVLRGTINPTVIVEHEIRYTVDLLEGQKTGFFLDQRENRAAMRRYCSGARVLDCFCNDGGFALNASRGGAENVIGMDVSQDAVQRASNNAQLNQIGNVKFEKADAFEKLKHLHSASKKFDIVILDPPAFAKSKKSVPAARRGYRELNALALRLVKENGILATASCSHHIEPDTFLDIVDETARKHGRQLQLLEWRGAAPDHPTLPAVPETRYLKFGIFRAV
jgi:23S rRNA (cytosine1962-C5)-methyltransferase